MEACFIMISVKWNAIMNNIFLITSTQNSSFKVNLLSKITERKIFCLAKNQIRLQNLIKHLKWSFLGKMFSGVDYFFKKLHFRCLKGFWIRFYYMPMQNKSWVIFKNIKQFEGIWMVIIFWVFIVRHNLIAVLLSRWVSHNRTFNIKLL